MSEQMKCKWCGEPIRPAASGGIWVHEATSKNWCHKKKPMRGSAEFHAMPKENKR